MRHAARLLAAIAAAAAASLAAAQGTPVAVGISGWTGFAPLTLAREAGIFKKNGLDVPSRRSRRRIATSPSPRATSSAPPPPSRPGSRGTPTASPRSRSSSWTGASGRMAWLCAATSRKIADLKGKKVAASAPGTAPYFTLAWFLRKNGLSVKDVSVVNLEPQAAANAFVTGQDISAAMTYEPYLSIVRAKPEAGRIIATTLDYPMIMDTFGCTPKFLAENAKAAQALADSYFEAVEMIAKDTRKSFEIMGADVKQTPEQFDGSQKYLRWQDRTANQRFFAGAYQAFARDAADVLIEAGIIKSIPDIDAIIDTRFVQ
jgi:NitT/TauT family transport system substrate-binding protein